MKNHQQDVLLIYYKRKDGQPLTGDEEQAWAQYRDKYPLPDEAQFDEQKILELAQLQQHMPTWEQFKQKHNIKFPIACPDDEKQEATAQVVRSLSGNRMLAVAASLFSSRNLRLAAAACLVLLLGAIWWYNRTAEPDIVKVEAQEILPGTTKATLYLAGHRTITLDSTVRRSIAQQGAVNVGAPQPGLLVYTDAGDNKVQQPVTNSIKVPRGGEYQLILADGTKVWLNAASVFRYPVAFGKGPRIVQLEEGEAYFEVAKRTPAQPFVVKIKGKQVEVLGTHFNVNAYGIGPVAATLVEGKVKVTDGVQQQLLQPGQQAVMDAKGIRVAPVNIQDATAWKNRSFSFHDTRLSVIMDALARWYDVEVVYKDPLNDEQFVIEHPRSAPLKYLLEDLEASNLVHFKVEGRKIIISR